MPLVHIHLRKGKASEYLRELGDSVHEALVSQANVPILLLPREREKVAEGRMRVPHPALRATLSRKRERARLCRMRRVSPVFSTRA
jgi:hypothetical protein